MLPRDLLIGAVVSIFCGLDRTAALQLMVSRPIVAAPLTGLLLGDPLAGLFIGALLELLWLGRLPMGAAIPPDDTQVAVGSTFLAVVAGAHFGFSGEPFTLLTLIVALPLGKLGQYLDRAARFRNVRLVKRAEAALDEGRVSEAEREHLKGLGHFALAALGTFTVITAGGWFFLQHMAPFLLEPVSRAGSWLKLVFPLVGAAQIVGSINVSRSVTLFGASFTMALILLWLL